MLLIRLLCNYILEKFDASTLGNEVICVEKATLTSLMKIKLGQEISRINLNDAQTQVDFSHLKSLGNDFFIVFLSILEFLIDII